MIKSLIILLILLQCLLDYVKKMKEMQSKLFSLFFRELFVRFWRQFVKFNLFDFEFESFSEMLEIESELFEED